MRKHTKNYTCPRIVKWGGGTQVFTLIIAASAVLAGCTGTIARGKALALQEQGYPPGFVAGYEDGCQAGFMQAGNGWATFKQDVNLYNTDAQYQQGWNNGRTTCFESSSRNRRELR